MPRERRAFAVLIASTREAFIPQANELGKQVTTILTAHAELRTRIAGELPLSWVEAGRDIDAQLGALVHAGFLRVTPSKWLQRMPRYLKAIELRIGKLDHAPDKDRLRRSEIEPLFARYLQTSTKGLKHPELLLDYKWQLEELRVSIFAQELGALEKVSFKRLDRLWQDIS
jgi:ATP-dependent helicase HrpA